MPDGHAPGHRQQVTFTPDSLDRELNAISPAEADATVFP
jgi:hypothetical protein